MQIGTDPADAPTETRHEPSRLTLCLVMADAACAEDERKIQALRALGHTVVPVVLASAAAGVPQDTVLLGSVETSAALSHAAANPAGLAAAVRFAQRQRGLPRRMLLRAAARLAFVARDRGCTHLHASVAHNAAAIAICAARIAGLTASFTAHDMLAAERDGDLALTLAAADLAVTGSDACARAARRLAPHAHIRMIPPGGTPERLAAAFTELA